MRKIKVLLIVLLIVFVSGCTVKSKEDLMSEITQIAKASFEEPKTQTTVKLNNFSLYLPEKFEVVEEGTSNLILQKGEQLYILFQNPLEDSNSHLNYDTAAEEKGYTLLESFEEQDKFGFVMVMPREDEKFELQTGVGGVKLTTITELDNLTEDTEVMMEMANSLLYSSENK